MKRCALLIYNPDSGFLADMDAGSVASFFESLLETLPGIKVDLLPFQGNALADIRKRLQEYQPDEVWVAGGDGTVVSIASMVSGLGIPLGVIPGGTMNLLARDLGMHLDIRTAILELKDAVQDRIDMATLNGQVFLCLSNIGITTLLTKRREQLRRAPAWIRWPLLLAYVLKSVVDYPVLGVELVLNGRVHRIRTRSVTITNNPLSRDSILIPSRTSISNGKLGIYVAHDTSFWSIPRLMLKLIIGKWKEDEDLETFLSSSLTITSRKRRRMMVMVDGEIRKTDLPLRYESLPGALTVLRPGGRA